MVAGPKLPPARVARAADAVRGVVGRLHRRMAPPPATLLELIMGSMVSQAVHVAARLGIADQLAAGPLTVEQIAEQVEASPDGVRRLLRALAGQGLFAARPDGRYELTPLGEPLRSDAPVSVRPVALLFGSAQHWEHWGHLLDAIRSGEPVLPSLRGMDAWAYLEADPEFASLFNNAMTSISDFARDPVAAAYDFTPFGTIVDVGGGHGALLAAILARTPTARGVLFDLPHVTAGAPAALQAQGVESRCAVESGSFFDSVPAGGDAYLLKNIIHDWPEDQAVTILRGVRQVMKPQGRLLLVEFVLPEGNTAHWGKLIDLEMLLVAGGRERTEAEYRDLLARAGFRLTAVVPTASPLSIVEARPA
jgi:C-methyltransferase